MAISPNQDIEYYKIIFKIFINKNSLESKDEKTNKTIDGEIVNRDKDEL